MKKSLYLQDIPLIEARKRLQDVLMDAGIWKTLAKETIPVGEQALGRVLTDPIRSKLSSPHYNSAAMDGFAVQSKDTMGAKPAFPVILKNGNPTKYVDTGDPIPEGCNAVIPIEEVESLDETGTIAKDPRAPIKIQIRASIVPWKNIRMLGEDISLSQLIFSSGHVLQPVDLGVIAAAGYSEINVARKPLVAILPTGSELVPIGYNPGPGDILEFNSIVLAGKILQWGGLPTRFAIIPDDYEKILNNVMKAAEDFDLILLIAGSSAGSEDYSATVIGNTGELLVHGVAVHPGHPVIIGTIKNGRRLIPIIGIPGFPISAALTTDIFVENLMNIWLGRQALKVNTIQAKLTRKLVSSTGDDDYIRVALAKVGRQILASPLAKGAGMIRSLAQADGILIVPSGVQGYEKGTEVKINLLKSENEIDRTILCIGSHDLILDELSQYLSERNRRFLSVNVGSLGGLIALSNGESHMAGSHLLDPETGEYNLRYVKEYVTLKPVRIIALAKRDQGLLVRKGNPKKIITLADLRRKDVTIINRQRGSGTRILLDFHLDKNKLLPKDINGYGQEEYTHLGVAAAVISGRVDCGLGIAAAAAAYDLDFIPLFNERYDLIIDQQFADSDLISPLYAVLHDKKFRETISKMKGYDVEIMGKVIAELSG
jgi:putative molybdopterin biosynthesis protein